MVSTFSKLIPDESGAVAIKYGFIAALIAVAAIVGTNLIALFNLVAGDL